MTEEFKGRLFLTLRYAPARLIVKLVLFCSLDRLLIHGICQYMNLTSQSKYILDTACNEMRWRRSEKNKAVAALIRESITESSVADSRLLKHAWVTLLELDYDAKFVKTLYIKLICSRAFDLQAWITATIRQ